MFYCHETSPLLFHAGSVQDILKQRGFRQYVGKIKLLITDKNAERKQNLQTVWSHMKNVVTNRKSLLNFRKTLDVGFVGFNHIT
jgi:hypothetical protein